MDGEIDDVVGGQAWAVSGEGIGCRSSRAVSTKASGRKPLNQTKTQQFFRQPHVSAPIPTTGHKFPRGEDLSRQVECHARQKLSGEVFAQRPIEAHGIWMLRLPESSALGVTECNLIGSALTGNHLGLRPGFDFDFGALNW
jgi:hypothetical protein